MGLEKKIVSAFLTFFNPEIGCNKRVYSLFAFAMLLGSRHRCGALRNINKTLKNPRGAKSWLSPCSGLWSIKIKSHGCTVIVSQRLVQSRSETMNEPLRNEDLIIVRLRPCVSVSCLTAHVNSFGTSGLFFCI